MKNVRTELGHRCLLLSVAVIALGGALPWALAEQTPPAASKPEPGTTGVSEDRLPIGKECVAVIDSQDGPTEVRGRLKRMDEGWLVLHAELEARVERGAPVLNKVPYVSRLYKNVGIGRTSEDVWIPRERLLYVRVAEDAFFERPSAEEESAKPLAPEPPQP